MMTTDPRKFDADRAAFELDLRSWEYWHQKALECAADLAHKDAEIEKLRAALTVAEAWAALPDNE